MDLWTKKEDHAFFIPAVSVESRLSLQFGPHQLSLIPFPGHSVCTMITEINGRFLHVADELMFSNDGRPILPYSGRASLTRHIESLNRLRDHRNYTMIPGHGPVLNDPEAIQRDIEDRLTYFNAIAGSDRRLTYEEAVRDCRCDFLHSEWHESNCR